MHITRRWEDKREISSHYPLSQHKCLLSSAFLSHWPSPSIPLPIHLSYIQSPFLFSLYRHPVHSAYSGILSASSIHWIESRTLYRSQARDQSFTTITKPKKKHAGIIKQWWRDSIDECSGKKKWVSEKTITAHPSHPSISHLFGTIDQFGKIGFFLDLPVDGETILSILLCLIFHLHL